VFTWIKVSIQAEIDMVESLHAVFYQNGFLHLFISDLFEKNGKQWFEIATYILQDDKFPQRKAKLLQDIWHLQAFDLCEIAEARFSAVKDPAADIDATNNLTIFWATDTIGIKLSDSEGPTEALPRGAAIISISPGQAFGLGIHPSTHLSIKALEVHSKPHMSILDVGTGSGILAITAAKLGSEHIVAIDIDEKIITGTQRNIDMNGCTDQISLHHASVSDISKQFDLVIANLSASIIIMNSKYLIRQLKPRGTLIVSGFLETQVHEIQRAVPQLTQVDEYQEHAWKALVFQAPN